MVTIAAASVGRSLSTSTIYCCITSTNIPPSAKMYSFHIWCSLLSLQPVWISIEVYSMELLQPTLIVRARVFSGALYNAKYAASRAIIITPRKLSCVVSPPMSPSLIQTSTVRYSFLNSRVEYMYRSLCMPMLCGKTSVRDDLEEYAPITMTTVALPVVVVIVIFVTLAIYMYRK